MTVWLRFACRFVAANQPAGDRRIARCIGIVGEGRKGSRNPQRSAALASRNPSAGGLADAGSTMAAFFPLCRPGSGRGGFSHHRGFFATTTAGDLPE